MPEDKKDRKPNQSETAKAEESLWSISFVEVSRALDHLNSSPEVLAAILEPKSAPARDKEANRKLEERLKPFDCENFASARAFKPVF
jgi:hypothetical protein